MWKFARLATSFHWSEMEVRSMNTKIEKRSFVGHRDGLAVS